MCRNFEAFTQCLIRWKGVKILINCFNYNGEECTIKVSSCLVAIVKNLTPDGAWKKFLIHKRRAGKCMFSIPVRAVTSAFFGSTVFVVASNGILPTSSIFYD